MTGRGSSRRRFVSNGNGQWANPLEYRTGPLSRLRQRVGVWCLYPWLVPMVENARHLPDEPRDTYKRGYNLGVYFALAKILRLDRKNR